PRFTQHVYLPCAAFKVQTLLKAFTFSGAYSGGATPVPIPNTAVKPSSADGTARATERESRSVPESFYAARGCINLAWRWSPVAQWQSTRLLTEGLLVRVQPGEPDFKPPISAVFCFIAAPPGCSGGVVAFPGSMTFVLNRVSVRTHTLRPRCSSSIPRPTTKRLGARAIRARCTRDPHHPHACFRFCLRGSSRLIVRFQACHRVLRDR